MATGKQLVDFVKLYVGGGYALGAQGEVLTKEHLAQLVKWNGRSHYYFVGYSAEKWIGKVCFDCSGLIVAALQKLGVFSAKEDYTAQGFWTNKVVPITKDDLAPGCLLFHFDKSANRMSHVGVYIGDNKIVEAKGTKYGVVISSLPGSWTHFGRLKQLTYSVPVKPVIPPLVMKGNRGENVELAQQLLNKKLSGVKGFKKLEEDGIFGKLTDAATRQFQKLDKLVVDGEIGPQTWGALLK